MYVLYVWTCNTSVNLCLFFCIHWIIGNQTRANWMAVVYFPQHCVYEAVRPVHLRPLQCLCKTWPLGAPLVSTSWIKDWHLDVDMTLCLSFTIKSANFWRFGTFDNYLLLLKQTWREDGQNKLWKANYLCQQATMHIYSDSTATCPHCNQLDSRIYKCHSMWLCCTHALLRVYVYFLFKK